MPLLDWVNRNQAEETATQVPYHLLKFEQSYGDEQQAKENLIIQGDNLLALKALLPLYGGQVKCIFIDPPYNTQTAFEHYDDKLEHAQWLSMMYPRLQLLKELLAEDGSIWITLDDNEAHYLKVMCDEVFGRKNFLSNFVWQKSYGGGSKAKWFVGLHENILCYAKNTEVFPEMWLPPDPEAVKKYYKYQDEKILVRGPYRLQPLATTSMDDRPNLKYGIPYNGIDIYPEKQWQWSKDRALRALENNELVFSEKNGKVTVSYKQYLKNTDGEERGRKPVTIINGHYTQHGTNESVKLFGQSDKFSFPKPEGLLNILLECCTDKNDLILDSFLGSGTTAAVAHKMGRRYIGIEMGEHAQTHVIPRLAKVIEGEQGGISSAVNWQGGGGFSFYTLGSPVFDDNGFLNADVKFKDLASYVWWLETKFSLNQTENFDNPFLGIHEGTAYYLLYNGILGDRRPNGGNVLTSSVLSHLNECHAHDGKRIVIGEASRLSPARLESLNIEFKQIPYSLYGNKAK